MGKLGVALGGGGARGLAHIGVLKVLERENISLHAITGCSMGAIIGGLYAYFQKAAKVEDFILAAIAKPEIMNLDLGMFESDKRKTDESMIRRVYSFIHDQFTSFRVTSDLSVFKEEDSIKAFSMLPDVNIEDLPLKFSAIATDLLTGKEINFTKGSLINALRASAAIPGIFPPVPIDEYLLIDGSTSESVPVEKVKSLGVDRILAIDVTRGIGEPESLNNAVEIVFRAEEITSFYLSKIRMREADLIISPEVKALSWADFKNAENIIKSGEEAAEGKLDELKKLSGKSSFSLKFDHFKKNLNYMISIS